MSHVIPMALRPTGRIAMKWNTVTLAFARRYCSQQSCLTLASPSPILSSLPSRRFQSPTRSFSTTPRFAAKVHNPPEEPTIPPQQTLPQRKRTVRIGPLPTGPVDGGTITRIFGPRVSLLEGNNALRILHHRRTSGSLADFGVDNLGNQYSHINRLMATKGLDWLRETFPIDEARAAEEWAEKEANRIAYELWLADPENESKYKDPARAFREQQKKEAEKQEIDAQEQGEGQRIGMLHAGKSQFERNIEENRRKRLEEITKVAEEKEARAKNDEVRLATGEYVRTPSGTQLMKPGQSTYVDIFGREQVSRRKEEMERQQQKSQTGFKDEAEMLAATTLMQRLYPSSAFVLIVCLLSYGFAHYYIPPSPEYRLWPDLSLTTATLAAIIAVNTVVCLAWRWTPLWPFMTRYFMHVPGYPRFVQAVTNVFSHLQYEHLLGNTMMFLLVAPVCHDLVGRGVFLGTYVSAGAVGSLFTLYWANLGRGKITAHSVGASAAIWGISALYCLLTDQNSIKIPFLKDQEVSFYPKLLFAAFVIMELANARRNRGRTTMDHASHFGGMAVGMSTAGYLYSTGWQSNRAAAVGLSGAGQTEVQTSTIDVGKILKDEVNEVKEGVKEGVKKIVK